MELDRCSSFMQLDRSGVFTTSSKHFCTLVPASSMKHYRGPPHNPCALLTSCEVGQPHGLTVEFRRQSGRHWLVYNPITQLMDTAPRCCAQFFLFPSSTTFLHISHLASVNQSPLHLSSVDHTQRRPFLPSCHPSCHKFKIHMSAIWSISACKSVLSDHRQDRCVRAHPHKAIEHADGRRETIAVNSHQFGGQ